MDGFKKVLMVLDQYILQITDFVRVHQVWAAPVVFVLCFAESLAFISLLIPAWAALVGIGALIGASGLNFWPIWIAGAIGAAFGDWLSYWIGLKLENRVYHMWPLTKHPNLIPMGERFVKNWGAAAVVIGRVRLGDRSSVWPAAVIRPTASGCRVTARASSAARSACRRPSTGCSSKPIAIWAVARTRA